MCVLSQSLRVLLLLAATTLSACGGGSGGSPPNSPPAASFNATPGGGPPPLAVTFDASDSSDSDGSITGYAWEFGNGATGSGRTVQHTFAQSGAYQVRLTVTDNDGAQGSATEELVVNVLPAARIAADPVDGEAPVTVTFDASQSTDDDGEIVSFAWDFAGDAQASGALVEHTFAQPGVYAVRLTVTDDLDGVAEVVFEVNARDGKGVAFTVPYVSTGAYADALRPCAYSGQAEETECLLSRLPFLGTEFPKPTAEDVLTRVLVSHRWLGDSFREMLEQLPEDVRLLARSVTAIVIASDIRPAYYSPASGAIYLDADFFWRTPEERAVVTMQEDFRSGFGSTLGVQLPWRMVRNNLPWGAVTEPDGATRAGSLLPFMAFLLYHELSHAADLMEASRIDGLNPESSAIEAIIAQGANWPSSRLARELGLRSSLLRELAGVFFQGRTATPEQEALRPDDLVEAFALDGAVDFYSYSSQFEALADLHDAILMSYHHGYEKDTGIVGTESDSVAESIVAWGQRGRMTDAAVIDRMRWVIDTMYPGDAQSLHGYLNARPAPLPMRRGDTWADNLVLEGGAEFNSGFAAPGEILEASLSGSGAGYPSLVGCIRVSDGAPAALRERLGLR